ncbi:MAG: hypothetical protein MJ016_08070 [Victivallaceae bacterium]|nr:hypothetical protein [Victivallaceae bacterium]
MRKALVMLLAFAVALPLSAIPRPKDAERRKVYRDGEKLEGIFKVPASKGGSIRILFLGGGRPWQGNALGGALIKAGADVRVLSGVYLAGLSGSYIRSLPHQTEEPAPVDAITPEFKHLDEYEMVFIDAIPEENQKKIFTPERVAAVRKFVSEGGLLLLTINAPAEELGDLMPVAYGETVNEPENLVVRKPASPHFDKIPDIFEVTDSFRMVKLVPGATSICSIYDASGAEVAPFVAVKPYENGKVMYINTEKNRRNVARHFAVWAHSTSFMIDAVAELSGKDLVHKTFERQPTEPPKSFAEKTVEITPAEMKFDDRCAQAEVSGREIRFANGVKIVVKEDNSYDAYLPGSETPFVVGATVPKIMFSKKQMNIEDASAEAVGMKDHLDAGNIQWTLSGIRGGDVAGIVWKGDEGSEIVEEIKASRLDLDGTTYRGIGRRARVTKCAYMISGIGYSAQADIGATKMRRMACYQTPRGYAEYDFTENKDIDSRQWGFFSDGQPFGWLEGQKSVFAVFTDGVSNTLNCQITKKTSEKLPKVVNNAGFGFAKAPVESGFLYYMVGAVENPGDNHWMAMYQFQRHNLRRAADLPEFPAYPNATWSNTCSKEQRDATIEKIGKAKVRYVYIPLCPSCMDDLDKPNTVALYKKIVDAGVKPYQWSPCGHSVGAGEWFEKQTSWYACDADGKTFKYFGGNFPVIDQGNEDFLKWYLAKIKNATDNGLAGVWFDMGGSATGTRNFAKPDSPIGLVNLVKYIYPAFYKTGGFVAIEGQSPLVLEGFWYRANVYTPMGGREFAFVGDLVYGDGIDFDYFRSSMFGFFSPLAFENYGTNFERIPGELKQLSDAAHYAGPVAHALDVLKMPFIRKTDFGTTWVSDTGAVLFFYDAVEKLSVKAPEGFVPTLMLGETGEAVELDGKMPASAGPRSFILLEKK